MNINTPKEPKSEVKRIITYPSKYEINSGKQETVENIIKEIKARISRDFIEKDRLPIAYFSAVDFKGRKKSENVTQHSGLVIIDVDVKDNPLTDFEKLYNDIQWNSYTYACFRSPSNGIKIVFNTGIQDIRHHNAYYQAITEYLLEHYPSLDEIDTSGSNISRGCYLPFDTSAYYNPYADIFRVEQNYIVEYIKANPVKSKNISSLKPLLQVEHLSYEDHYKNMENTVKTWTSLGIEGDNKETLVGIPEECEKKTSVGVLEQGDIGTSVGVYDSIFNEYRFHNIGYSVIRSNVPFFEMLVLKNATPTRIEYKTRLDEEYFKRNPNLPISTDDFDGLDGLEVCEFNPKAYPVIREGKRGKTLTLICTQLFFNNPFCHPALIAKELQKINFLHCEDPNPETNPAPDEQEINAIVSNCYQMFIAGELDFTDALRKKKNFKDISKRRVFCSRYKDEMNTDDKHRECYKTYTEGKRNKNLRNYERAISALQDGKKITVKRIAEYMGLSTKQVCRYRNDNLYAELMAGLQKTIDEYNNSLKAKKPKK